MDKALKNQAALGAAEELFTGPFGMRHESGYVPTLVADASHIPKRAIRIRGVSHFAVSDGNLQQLVRRNLVRKRRVGRERFQIDMLAAELQRAVADQRAR